MKKVVISQPRYLPALNYLQRICFAEIFVIFDTVQRQSRAWENRNKLLLPEPEWLTVPIVSSSRARISDVVFEDTSWIDSHKARIIQSYEGAPYFDPEALDCYYSAFEPGPDGLGGAFPPTVARSIQRLFDLLDLRYDLRFASALERPDDSAAGATKLRLLCERVKADVYVSGPNGREYGVVPAFEGSRCRVLFHEYDHPVYPQVGNAADFVPHMGFFDALFNCGRDWFREALLTPPLLRP